MSFRLLEHWTELACNYGQALQDLSDAVEVKETLAVDGNDSLTFLLPSAVVVAGNMVLRDVIRLTDSLGNVREYRVRRLETETSSGMVSVTCGPVMLDLSTAGVVFGPDGTTTIAASLTPSQWIANYVLANLSLDLITYLAAGTVSYTTLVTLSLENVTRLELLRELQGKLGCELDIRRNGETGYLIDLIPKIGAGTATAYALEGRNLLDAAIAQDDEYLATVAQPFGAKPNANAAAVTLAQMAWRVTAITGTGPYTLTLADGASGAGPILVDSQLDGLYLESPDGTYHMILSSASGTQEVTANTIGTIAVGKQIRLAKNAEGLPVGEVTYPPALDQYGRVAVPMTVNNARGERNFLEDGNFSFGGLANVTVTTGVADLYPSAGENNVNGTVTSNTTSSTSLPVQGFPAGTVFRRGEAVVVGDLLIATSNADVTLGSATIASSSTTKYAGENITIPLASALTVALTNGQSLRMVTPFAPVLAAGTEFTVTVVGAHSIGATSVTVSGLQATRKIYNGDKIRFQRGGTFVATTATNPTFFVNLSSSFQTVYAYLYLGPTYGLRLNGSGRSPDTQTSARAMSVYDYVTGITHNLTWIDTGNPTGTVLYVSKLMPPYGVSYINIGANVSVVQSATTTVAITSATQSWSTSRTASITWDNSPMVTIDGTSFPPEVGSAVMQQWRTSGGNLIGNMTISATLNSASRTATFTTDIGYVYGNGSTLTKLGSTYYLASSATMDGTGAGTIVLSSSLSGVAGQAVNTQRHNYAWPTNGGGANLIRLGGNSPEIRITPPVYVNVPDGTTVNVVAIARAHYWNGGVPITGGGFQMMVYDSDTEELIASASMPNSVGLLENAAVMKCTYPLSTSRNLQVRFSGYLTGLPSLYAMLEYVAFYKGTSDQTIPFTQGSFANVLWQEANIMLSQRGNVPRTIEARVVDLSRALKLPLDGMVLEKGGTLKFETLGITSRIVGLSLNHSDPAQTTLTLDTQPTRVSSLV